MYCPVCLNNSLKLQSRAVVKLTINGVSKDNSLFVVNVGKDSDGDLLNRLTAKIDELLQWYSTFNNTEAISKVELISGDCSCVDGCVIKPDTKVSLIGLVYKEKEIEDILNKVAQKYGLTVKLNP